jgi:hypothetical protein
MSEENKKIKGINGFYFSFFLYKYIFNLKFFEKKIFNYNQLKSNFSCQKLDQIFLNINKFIFIAFVQSNSNLFIFYSDLLYNFNLFIIFKPLIIISIYLNSQWSYFFFYIA